MRYVDLPNGTLNLPGCLAPNMLVSSVHAGQRSSISFPNGRVERHGSRADGSTCRLSICHERPRRSASLRKNRQCGLASTANGHNGAQRVTARALTRGNRTLDPNGPTGYVGSHRGGRLLEDAIHAAGRVFDGEKVIVAALWTLDGFKRAPVEEMDKQARLIAQSKATHRSVRGAPLRYN